jgi:hypothetical protein
VLVIGIVEDSSLLNLRNDPLRFVRILIPMMGMVNVVHAIRYQEWQKWCSQTEPPLDCATGQVMHSPLPPSRTIA